MMITRLLRLRGLRIAVLVAGGSALMLTTVWAAPCGGSTCLDNPTVLGIPQLGLASVFKDIITILSFTAGVLSAVFLVIGGIRYSTSSGNSKQIESARQTLTFAVIGLIVSILAPVIVAFMVSRSP
jgi:Type IV secretion system pilin